ncbi:histidine phosphatase family protein [Nesterenkonia ebinurensis]|uniref:histidine phosphatase family protein n=1 Tax=Nesterenkonia ebinurensis TaxID=2608252 RepID=UPI00123D0130
MSGLTRGELEVLYPGALHKRSQNWYHWQFPGGESYAGAAERAASALHAAKASDFERPVMLPTR